MDPSHSKEASLDNTCCEKTNTVKDDETTYHTGQNIYNSNVKILCRGNQVDLPQIYQE